MFGVSSYQSTVRTVQITTKPPRSGPGFDGLDADGDGGVRYRPIGSDGADLARVIPAKREARRAGIQGRFRAPSSSGPGSRICAATLRVAARPG